VPMTRLRVSGMTCGHCEGAVQRALAAVPGVTRVVSVSREAGLAVVEGPAEPAALLEAVREEGYEVEVQT